MPENLDQVPGLLRDALVLVTGAGQGNGRAIALGVAAAGARVIVTDVRQDTAQSAADEIQASHSPGVRAPAFVAKRAYDYTRPPPFSACSPAF